MPRRYDNDGHGNSELVWVSPGSVVYNAEDIDLLLPWLIEMREGAYPVEPTGGYARGKRSGTTRAYYEQASQVAAEIDRRLAMTGTDRELVEKAYCEGYEDEDISKHYHMDVYDVRRRINSAVSFISSGPCPRWLPCSVCGKMEKCNKYRSMLEKGQKRITYTYRQWVRSRSRQHQKERSRR